LSEKARQDEKERNRKKIYSKFLVLIRIMMIMNKKILTILEIGAFAIMVGLNVHHAANNYGVLDNNLANGVIAQTNSSGEWRFR
jgi:hypothetical protein